jgi:hypothetical protein
MESDHGLGHALAGLIRIKAAINPGTMIDQGTKPGGIGPGARGGDATMVWMKGEGADGINGRFTKDERVREIGGSVHGEGKEAEVFAGTRSHTTPMAGSGSAKFGSDWGALRTPEEEDGIGSVVGVKRAGIDERIDPGQGDGPLGCKIIFDPVKLKGIGWRKEQG